MNTAPCEYFVATAGTCLIHAAGVGMQVGRSFCRHCPKHSGGHAKPNPNAKPPRLPLPGNVLRDVIHRLGFSQKMGCGCATMQAAMNKWGWVGCWTHRQEIIEWLATKAASQGITVDDATITALLKAAIREYRNRD